MLTTIVIATTHDRHERRVTEKYQELVLGQQLDVVREGGVKTHHGFVAAEILALDLSEVMNM